MILNVIKIFGLSSLSFFIGILFTPLLTHYLYKYEMWRKDKKEFAPDGSPLTVYKSLKKDDARKVPRVGGILIWGVVVVVALFFWMLAQFWPTVFTEKINFFSRSQTWLPLATLLAGSLVGLADDLMQIWGGGRYIAGGMRFSRRVFLIGLIAASGAYWFYFKLGVDSIHVPFGGDVYLGWLMIPFFMVAMYATFSGGVIDGLDGLAGGVLASAFSAYGGIAYAQNQMDLAAFCGVVVGAILTFLWFNIPPARFYMGETGIMGLTTTLTVVAFLTKAVVVLPIIALPLVLASASVIIQLSSKRFFGRKVFLVAPIHHHFEALGWPSYKVTMRFWVVSVISAVLGMVLALVG
jgi:phospho-N-acetylmuramoyl-pentapeptide-transferase